MSFALRRCRQSPFGFCWNLTSQCHWEIVTKIIGWKRLRKRTTSMSNVVVFSVSFIPICRTFCRFHIALSPACLIPGNIQIWNFPTWLLLDIKIAASMCYGCPGSVLSGRLSQPPLHPKWTLTKVFLIQSPMWCLQFPIILKNSRIPLFLFSFVLV